VPGPDLRREGRSTLDAVMRALWARCGGGPMTEADFAEVLHDLGGRSFSANWHSGYTARASCLLRELLQAVA
jgi:predicted metalloprotease with PDZ domain